MKTRGLRFEIVVGLALLVAAATGIMGMIVFKYVQREMITQKIETGMTLVRLVEMSVDRTPGEERIRSVYRSAADAGFTRVFVVDASGRRILGADHGWPSKAENAKALQEAMATRRAHTELTRPRWFFFGGEPSLILTAPLFEGVRVVGAVRMYSPLSEIRDSWIRIRWVILLYLVVDTLIAVLFGTYLMSRRLVDPLRRMVRRVEDMAEGHYQPGALRIETRNEIGVLEEAFEVMAARLLQSRTRLEKNLVSLREAQENLVRSEKMASVGRLAAGLAHELGNPMGSISGFMHLLRRGDLPDEEREDFMRRMQSELTRMDGIIRSLLDYARQRPVIPGPVDLNHAARKALSLAEVQKWFDGIEVETAFQDGLPMVRGETNRLLQVILNLLTNAGQAMAGSGRLTLTTGVRDGEVFIAVADTGPGIDEEIRDKIFDPFFTTKEPGRGTGLGLSVSQSIVESLGGRIKLTTSPGGDTVFEVFLQIEEAGEKE